MKRTAFLSLVMACLTSCTVNLQDPRKDDQQWRQEVWTSRDRATPEWVNERKLTNCPVYTPPEYRAVPVTPAEEFRRIPKTQIDRREEILLDHIQALREHIKATKSDTTDQYMKYLMQCTAAVKPK